MKNILLALRYFRYRLHALNAQGIHSPFVFDTYTQAICGKTDDAKQKQLSKIQKKSFQDSRILKVTDYGTAEGESSARQLSVKYIAKHYASGKKKAGLLYRLTKHFKPENILEMGTSLGIGTTALALGSPLSKIVSMEGCPETASIAMENFHTSGLKNIEVIEGEFSKTLLSAFEKIPVVDLVFIDGNHRSEPTLRYFEQCLSKANENSLFIFDDIHWSDDMEEAWKKICSHPEVSITIDLFIVGLVFLRKGIVKQNFILQF
ncbi:MAG: class I SAM-dependent methyltransferase [Bacteroidia bacterium]|nr:class I SAM-dependent methyltransferase [Bacteroidia bacterium]